MTTRVSCKKEVPELKILQSLAFLAVVLQSALTYTINQPNLVPEQAIMMGMFFNFAKFSAPAFIFIVGFTLFYHHEKAIGKEEAGHLSGIRLLFILFMPILLLPSKALCHSNHVS